MMRPSGRVIGAAMGAAFLWACGRADRPEKPATPVTVRAVEAYAGGGGLRYSATIQAFAQVDLAFKLGGYVREILQVRGADGRMRDVDGGDRVTKSTVLARIRESDYVARLDQARGQYAEARKARDAAVADLARAQAAAEQATLDMERATNLYGTHSLTKVDYDAATARHAETRAQVEAGRAQIAVAEGRIAAAQAAVAQGQIQLGDTALAAPMDALILRRSVEAGDFAQPGRVGFTLADSLVVKVVFGVPDVVVARLAVGSPQTITAEAVPGVEFRGRLTRIAPSADPKSRVFDVEVTVPNPGYRLKVGLIASLQVGAIRPAAPVPVVPLSAVVRPKQDPTAYAVVVVEEQGGQPVARVRAVTLGETYGNTVGVTAGVKVGERVIVSGATLVGDGDRVRVIP